MIIIESARRCGFHNVCKRGFPNRGEGGNTRAPHLSVSSPADLGCVWNPWHLSCIPGWISAISVMDWGRRERWIQLNLAQATCVRMITWMLSSRAGLRSPGCQVAASNSRVSLRYLARTRKELRHFPRRGLMHVFGFGGKFCRNSWHISGDRFGAFQLQTKYDYKHMTPFSKADIWF